MDNHSYLLYRKTEEPVRLDYFQSLIHQCCRIDRDLLPHIPGRMLKRLLRRDRFEFLHRGFLEGPTRGSKDKSLHFFVRMITQSLEECAVFAVHRHQAGPAVG